MSNTAAVHENEQISIKKKSQIVDVWKRLCRNKTAVLGLIIVAILVLIAIFAPIVLDYETRLSRQITAML